jgi:organic hydroperoxide reductase OsmC/OhrA
MHRYTATVTWARGDAAFTDQRYSRAHRWRFDGGLELPASASPLHVAPPMSDPAGVDPEEAFVAALSSCHMLYFLWFAARRGLVVEAYHDEAIGEMGRDDRGRQAIVRVALRPRVGWAGDAPGDAVEDALHHEAHEACYLANSVRSEVVVEPVRDAGTAPHAAPQK